MPTLKLLVTVMCHYYRAEYCKRTKGFDTKHTFTFPISQALWRSFDNGVRLHGTLTEPTMSSEPHSAEYHVPIARCHQW